MINHPNRSKKRAAAPNGRTTGYCEACGHYGSDCICPAIPIKPMGHFISHVGREAIKGLRPSKVEKR